MNCLVLIGFIGHLQFGVEYFTEVGVSYEKAAKGEQFFKHAILWQTVQKQLFFSA